MTRNYTKEIEDARAKENWPLHERLWEERRLAEVEADEKWLRNQRTKK